MTERNAIYSKKIMVSFHLQVLKKLTYNVCVSLKKCGQGIFLNLKQPLG